MEIIIVLALVVAAVAIWSFNKDSKSLDINADGKVDVADAKAAVENTVEGIKSAADVNKDGVVDTKDVEVAVEVAKEEVKKTVRRTRKAAEEVAVKVEAAVKKPRGRQPKSEA